MILVGDKVKVCMVGDYGYVEEIGSVRGRKYVIVRVYERDNRDVNSSEVSEVIVDYELVEKV
jgi:hypothetical protein